MIIGGVPPYLTNHGLLIRSWHSPKKQVREYLQNLLIRKKKIGRDPMICCYKSLKAQKSGNMTETAPFPRFPGAPRTPTSLISVTVSFLLSDLGRFFSWLLRSKDCGSRWKTIKNAGIRYSLCRRNLGNHNFGMSDPQNSWKINELPRHLNMFAAKPAFARIGSRISSDMLKSLRRASVFLLPNSKNT